MFVMIVQEANSQGAAAALSSATTEEEDPDMDADVASESAALQSRCKHWITDQKAFQHRKTGNVWGTFHQSQHVQGSSHQPQPGHEALNTWLIAAWNLCHKLVCLGRGSANQPQGNHMGPSQPQTEQHGTLADNDYDLREQDCMQDCMQDDHHVALDAADTVNHAKNSTSRVAGHNAKVAHTAITEDLDSEAAPAEITAKQNGSDNAFAAVKLDQISNQRYVFATSIVQSALLSLLHHRECLVNSL